MRILVVGSDRHLDSGAQKHQFQSACFALGKAFAVEQHVLLLGSDSPQTADWHVAAGASSIKGMHKIEVFYSAQKDGHSGLNERAMPFHEDGKSILPHLNITFEHGDGPWPVAHSAAITKADLVIVIGGGQRAFLVAQFASAFKRPVLAIPCFGGTGEKIWVQFNSSYKANGITEKDREMISREWSSKSSQAALRIARTLVRNSPLRDKSKYGLPLLLAPIILAPIGWAYLLSPLHHWSLDAWPVLYVQQILAAFMGIALRIGFRALRDDVGEVRAIHLPAEFVVALALPFAFMLLFFLDDFVVTGTLSTLNDPDAFQRVSIAMSIVTLGASFSLEDATRKLAVRLSAHL